VVGLKGLNGAAQACRVIRRRTERHYKRELQDAGRPRLIPLWLHSDQDFLEVFTFTVLTIY
jgi:hypothetical protein